MTSAQNFDPKILAEAEALQTSVIAIDQDGFILWCNMAAEALIGSSVKSLVHTDVGLILPQVRLWLATLIESSQAGSVIPISGLTQLQRPLREAEPVNAVISVMSGGQVFLLEITALQEALKLAQQEQEMGSTSANKVILRNLAHEIKNPLGGIRGAAQLLDAELATPEQREFTEVIIAEADRLQGLVDRLLAPYRREHRILEVNVHEVLEHVKTIVLAEFAQGLSIERDYDVSAPPIMGDREQLIQVFLNLMRNAAEAMQEQILAGSARLTLRTRVSRLNVIQQKRYKIALQVNVIDNGCGIESAIKEKIFYPLVTGKQGGSGLGLALVQSYVEQHAGSIEVSSNPGHTDFKILFPYGKAMATVHAG